MGSDAFGDVKMKSFFSYAVSLDEFHSLLTYEIEMSETVYIDNVYGSMLKKQGILIGFSETNSFYIIIIDLASLTGIYEKIKLSSPNFPQSVKRSCFLSDYTPILLTSQNVGV